MPGNMGAVFMNPAAAAQQQMQPPVIQQLW